MRATLSLVFLCWVLVLGAQNPNLKIITWNIQDFGRTKTDAEIQEMALILRGYDVIAIQEVVAKDPAGAQAVARLAEALDLTGADYDFRVSDPTSSPTPQASERYAFLWRTSTVALKGRPTLLRTLDKAIDREPYLAKFEWEGKQFRVLTVHMRPHDKKPEQEIAAMRGLMDEYKDLPLFVAGDFNVTGRHTVFNPWKRRGFRLAAVDHQTTLRRKIGEDGSAYAHDIDNILVPAHQVNLREGGSLDLYLYFKCDLERTRALSDHVPVYVIIEEF